MIGSRRGLIPSALAGLGALAAAAFFAAGSSSATQPSMLTGVNGTNITPLITVGDTLPGGYRFESIPDGISLRERGQGRLDLYVNHETSTVAFPYNLPPSSANQNDFDNAQVSVLSMNQKHMRLQHGDFLITSSENYHRFCSNYLATEKEGFDKPILFTNEEAQDWVYRTGTSWLQTLAPGTPGAEQTGVVVATDVRNGKHQTIYGMGRFNHENDVAIPGYSNRVVVSGDDTFFTTQLAAPYKPAWSQFYSYIAPSADAIMNDQGDLWAFVSDNPAVDDYFDFAPGSPMSISGHFIKVPKQIARGKKADGTELLSSDFPGMLAPPNVTAPPPDGPQWVLDQWGNAENNTYGENVFRFVRIEDTAYDKRPGKSNVIYLADSGRATAGAAPAANRSTNGRVWKMVLDPNDPTKVTSLSILVEGDDNPTAATNPATSFNEIHQPDNVETTANGSLLVTEDPSTNNNYPPAGAPTTPARLWKLDLNAANVDASRVTVAKVDQSADGGPTDVPGSPVGALGSWESSGVVDASSVYGPGAFFIDVQAHSLWIEKANGPDVLAPVGPDWTYKREGGQLLLIHVPGA